MLTRTAVAVVALLAVVSGTVLAIDTPAPAPAAAAEKK